MSAPVPVTGLKEHLPLSALWPEHRTDRQGRAYGALWRAGIHTVGALTHCTASGLLEVENFSPWALGEVQARLGALGLSLRGEQVAR